MNIHKLLAAIALVGVITPFALAQDTKKEERKTGSEKEGKAGEGDSKGYKFDRGDEKAEKFLKKPYLRVYSAEEKGLKKLHAGSDISVDASAFGFGALEFAGDMWWRTGSRAIWEAAEDDTGGGNPLGNMSAVAKSLFEPYLGYVTGFEAWDVRFKEASFKFGDPVMEEEGEGDKKKSKEVGKTVIVDYAGDRSDDTFTVRENMVTNVAFDGEVQGQKSRVTFTYVYEDQGKQLRLSSVSADTEISVEGLPGQERDPKKPGAEGAAQKEKLTGKITVKKYGKVGEFEIALELEGELKMSMMGQELSFPTTLNLTDAKINDDVKDEDFPKEAGEAPSEDEEF
jgi:hypothetical protein